MEITYSTGCLVYSDWESMGQGLLSFIINLEYHLIF